MTRWQAEGGEQCRRVHKHVVEAGGVDLMQVQADEIRAKAVGSIFWMVCAVEVSSRLWLGGVVRASRDRELVRRFRCPARKRATVERGMWLVGVTYNFVRPHRSLREKRLGEAALGEGKWVERTPAEAAGLSDHQWEMEELMSCVVPPAELPKRRGRPPRWLPQAA